MFRLRDKLWDLLYSSAPYLDFEFVSLDFRWSTLLQITQVTSCNCYSEDIKVWITLIHQLIVR